MGFQFYVFTCGHFGVCVSPVCPFTVFNITPTKWGHLRQKLMEHIWGLLFALFPSKGSSRAGLDSGYEKSLTSRGSARKVQSNIIWCLTPITTLKSKCWELVCVLLEAKALEAAREGPGLSLPRSYCQFLKERTHLVIQAFIYFGFKTAKSFTWGFLEGKTFNVVFRFVK